MEARIKQILFLLVTLVIFTSCDSKSDLKNEPIQIIAYGTDEFKDFMDSNPKIDLEKSWDLQLEYYKNNPRSLDYKSYIASVTLFFIVDDNYVYTLNHMMKKVVKGKLLEGVWVNANTGEVKYREETKIIEAVNYAGWGGKR